MPDKEIKEERSVEIGGVIRYFEDTIDALKKGTVTIGDAAKSKTIQLPESDIKIKLKWKQKGGREKISLGFSWVSDKEKKEINTEELLLYYNQFTRGNLPNYEKLKKSMDENIKLIGESLALDYLPDPGVGEILYKQCQIRTWYKSKGEDLYNELLKHADEFIKGIRLKDIKKIKNAYNDMVSIEAKCHEQMV